MAWEELKHLRAQRDTSGLNVSLYKHPNMSKCQLRLYFGKTFSEVQDVAIGPRTSFSIKVGTATDEGKVMLTVDDGGPFTVTQCGSGEKKFLMLNLQARDFLSKSPVSSTPCSFRVIHEAGESGRVDRIELTLPPEFLRANTEKKL